MSEALVVISKVKSVAKEMGCNTAGDVAPALSEIVDRIVRKAVARAQADGRKTIKARDIDAQDGI